MKLTQLLESSSFEGFYSTFPIEESLRIQKIEELLQKPEFSEITFTEKFCLTSSNFELIGKFLSQIGEKPDLFYDSGKNPIHSITQFPRIINATLLLENNCKFTSLKNIHKHIVEIHGIIYCDCNIIKSHILGVLKIKGLTRFSPGGAYQMSKKNGGDLQHIINKYIPLHSTYAGGDIFDCQEELIEAGLEEYAQL